MAKKVTTVLRTLAAVVVATALIAGVVAYTGAMDELQRTGQVRIAGIVTTAESTETQPVCAVVGPAPEPTTERPSAVIVNPGDTLWQIASSHYPGKHTGAMIHEIRQANPGIDPGKLQVGQVVKLP